MDLGFKKKSVGLIIDLVREELDKLEGKEFEEAKQALIGSVFDAQISQGNWCHHFIDLALQEGDFNSIENGLNGNHFLFDLLFYFIYFFFPQIQY